jgi:hypothetical protein
VNAVGPNVAGPKMIVKRLPESALKLSHASTIKLYL